MLTKQPHEPKPLYQDDGLQLFSTQILMQLSPRVFAAARTTWKSFWSVIARKNPGALYGMFKATRHRTWAFQRQPVFFGCRCLWWFSEVILDHLPHFHLDPSCFVNLKLRRFLIAGLEPNSPAGSCHQAQGQESDFGELCIAWDARWASTSCKWAYNPYK